MALFDDEPVKPRRVHEIGQDLSLLSVDELDERIAALQAEIARLEAARHAKESSRRAADAFFNR